jgi:hypothetical protein
MDLKQLQSFIYKSITSPETLPMGLSHDANSSFGGIELLVLGDERLSALGRVDIYVNAYFYRLLDCLIEEFPATLAVVGRENFEALARDYLSQYPPSEPSIIHLGRDLAAFLCDHRLARQWPFTAELARLERIILDVFHAADAPKLNVESLRRIPAQHWPDLELRAHRGVEIVRGEWRVADVLRAVESGHAWIEPGHRNTTVIVWRQHARVHYRDLEEVEARGLALLTKGATFAAICEEIAADPARHDQTRMIGQLLARWLADEIVLADTSGL